MNKHSHRELRIAGGVLCLVAADLFFALPDSTTPRAVQILTAAGTVFIAALLLVWDTRTPAWLMWFLLFGAFAGLFSDDVYEAIQGQRHWLRLIPLPALLLIGIFARTRNDNAA